VGCFEMQEEEEQLLAGPKEESRTTAAMRKFVQEEEERLFLEKGPLRTKAQAIGTQILLCLTVDYNYLVFFQNLYYEWHSRLSERK
jgi:hypothetical protein